MFNCKVHNWSHIERLCPACSTVDLTYGTGSVDISPVKIRPSYPPNVEVVNIPNIYPDNKAEVASVSLPREQLLALMTAILAPHFITDMSALDKAREILDLVEG